jgi:hypothetical protein
MSRYGPGCDFEFWLLAWDVWFIYSILFRERWSTPTKKTFVAYFQKTRTIRLQFAIKLLLVLIFQSFWVLTQKGFWTISEKKLRSLVWDIKKKITVTIKIYVWYIVVLFHEMSYSLHQRIFQECNLVLQW